jgi:hypothetical protein
MASPEGVGGANGCFDWDLEKEFDAMTSLVLLKF